MNSTTESVFGCLFRILFLAVWIAPIPLGLRSKAESPKSSLGVVSTSPNFWMDCFLDPPGLTSIEGVREMWRKLQVPPIHGRGMSPIERDKLAAALGRPGEAHSRDHPEAVFIDGG